MDDFYRVIYEDIYLLEIEYPRMTVRQIVTNEVSGSRIRDRIDQAIQSLDLVGQIRPDAKLFLLTNFKYLIYLPLISSPGYTSRVPDLDRYITEDILSILREAKEVSRSRNQDNQISSYPTPETREISSHDVLIAIQSIWSSLRTLSINIWGD